MQHHAFFILLQCWVLTGWAQSLVERVVIQAQDGLVQVQAGKETTVGAEWLVEQHGKEMILIPREKSKKFVGKISIKEKNLEVHGRDLQSQMQNWAGDLLYESQKGKLLFQKSNVQGKIFLQKGEILFNETSGKWTVESFLSKVTVKDHQGDLDLRNFGGEVVLDSVRGIQNMVTLQGAIKSQKGSGEIGVDTLKGSVHLSQWSGRADVTNQEGNVYFQGTGESELHGRSQTGRWTLQVQPGALVNVAMQDGELAVPPPLKIQKDGAAKYFRGRWAGAESKSTIRIRAQEGVISLR